MVAFMTSLGFVIPHEIAELAGDLDGAEVSDERFDLLRPRPTGGTSGTRQAIGSRSRRTRCTSGSTWSGTGGWCGWRTRSPPGRSAGPLCSACQPRSTRSSRSSPPRRCDRFRRPWVDADHVGVEPVLIRCPDTQGCFGMPDTGDTSLRWRLDASSAAQYCRVQRVISPDLNMYRPPSSVRSHIDEGQAMRGHLPSNEVTAEGYAPIYHDTKARLESVFGERDARHWPAGEQTCSDCYSVTPALVAQQ